MLNYPTDAQAMAALYVAAAPIRSGAIQSAQEVRALWILAGYGLGRAMPDSDPTASRTAIAMQLEAAAASPWISILSQLPWAQILGVILQLLQGLAKQPAGGVQAPVPQTPTPQPPSPTIGGWNNSPGRT